MFPPWVCIKPEPENPDRILTDANNTAIRG